MKGLVAILVLLSTGFSSTPEKSMASAGTDENLEKNSHARLARSLGDLPLERLLLLRVMSGGREAAASARAALAQNAFGRNMFGEAVDLLLLGISDPKAAAARDDESLLGHAYLRAGRSDAASTIFAHLADGSPRIDDAAISAVRGLDAISRDVSETEHLRRAAIYQANRDFAAARSHYQAVIDASPTVTAAADAALQIGRGYALATDHTEAVNWFERVLEQYSQSPAAKDALLQAAASYSRVGKPKESIKRYQRFIDLYSADEKTERAYLNIVDVHRDLGEDFEALKWCTKTEEAFRGKVPEAVAIFAEARIHASRGDWQSSLAALDRLKPFSDLGGTTPGGTSAAEVSFLRANALEQLGRRGEATEAFLSIPRSNYYGRRAFELQPFTGTAKPLAIPATPRDPLVEFAGLSANRSISIAEPIVKKALAGQPFESIPREQMRLAYPAAFDTEVLRNSKQRGLDPRFVLAIIRQESRFDPFAHSTAAARGLMQLIMTTAARAGAEIGETAITEDDLYDPEFSIMLGTQHLADLFKAFPEQPEAVAAAYNASVENVRRWTARAKSNSPDRYVSEIMFAQTKDYVEKVMTNYRMYQYLYDEDLRPR